MARSKKNASPSPAAKATAAETPTNAPDIVSVDRATLLEAIIPDATHSGHPALTALSYVADELEAIHSCAENGTGDDEFLVENMLYRLRLRVRAIADLLGKVPSLGDRTAKKGAVS